MSDSPALIASEQRVADALEALHIAAQIRILDTSAATAQMAADALGVEVGRIVKSLVFRGAESGSAYFLMVAGDNRVHEKRVGHQLGEHLERADAEFVRQATGFAIGGVSPFGHPEPLPSVIDETLFRFETVWAAAGAPRAVFEISPRELFDKTGAGAIDVT
jgi:prolyl-tRNA editing enzyme YbaK/EbsC (Cys-tRNA(Pro) deacylase)